MQAHKKSGAAGDANEEVMPQALSMQGVQDEAKRKRQDFEAAEPVDNEQPRASKGNC